MTNHEAILPILIPIMIFCHKDWLNTNLRLDSFFETAGLFLNRINESFEDVL